MIYPKALYTPIPQSIELIIFDCDGVLVDSEVISQRVLLDMIEILGVNVSPDYFQINFLGHSFEHVKEKIRNDFSVELPTEFAQNYQQVLMQAFAEKLTPTAQLDWMLPQLGLPYCVATSSSPQRVTKALNITKLQHYFDECVFTASEVEKGKPAPDLFLHAARKMGTEPKNCLVIEDSQAGIQAAQAANMHIIHYIGASHLDANQVNNNRKPMENSLDSIEKTSDKVNTIAHWQQLFELAPWLSSSSKTKR